MIDENMLYQMIFKRKSFHLFRNIGDESISLEEIREIEEVYPSLTPLCPDIKTAVKVLPANETTCKRGQEYCILLYSEKKDNYLQNIGYIGGQLDLYLVSKNIGTLWYGIGKAEEGLIHGLGFVIMIAIAKIDDERKFRKNMFKSKRRTAEDIWAGNMLADVADIVRFAPSSCNTQPWMVECNADGLAVYRYKKAGKRGIMPSDKVSFYNRIDIGIFMCFLELCLKKNGIRYNRSIYVDKGGDVPQTLNAVYRFV